MLARLHPKVTLNSHLTFTCVSVCRVGSSCLEPLFNCIISKREHLFAHELSSALRDQLHDSQTLVEEMQSVGAMQRLVMPLLSSTIEKARCVAIEIAGMLLNADTRANARFKSEMGIDILGLYLEKHGSLTRDTSAHILSLALGEFKPIHAPSSEDTLRHPEAIAVLFRLLKTCEDEALVLLVLKRATVLASSAAAAAQMLQCGVLEATWLLLKKGKCRTAAVQSNVKGFIAAALLQELEANTRSSWVRRFHQMPPEWQQLALIGVIESLLVHPVLKASVAANIITNLVWMLRWVEFLPGWSPWVCKSVVQLINTLAGENNADTVELMKACDLLLRRDSVILHVVRATAHGIYESREWADVLCELSELVCETSAFAEDGVLCVLYLFDGANDQGLQLLYGILLKAVVGTVEANNNSLATILQDQQVLTSLLLGSGGVQVPLLLAEAEECIEKGSSLETVLLLQHFIQWYDSDAVKIRRAQLSKRIAEACEEPRRSFMRTSQAAQAELNTQVKLYRSRREEWVQLLQRLWDERKAQDAEMLTEVTARSTKSTEDLIESDRVRGAIARQQLQRLAQSSN